jgi:uncharacterized OsmC-like protein
MSQPLVTDDLAVAVRGFADRLSARAEGTTTVPFKADTRLVHNLLTEARMRGFTLTVDEGPSIGGTDQGPNPVELILAALGTCQEIVYALYAALLDVGLEGLEITVTGPLDPRGFMGLAPTEIGFEHVEMQTRITSRERPERIKELIDAVQAHCPVFDILRRPLEVRNRIELNGEALSAREREV